MKINHINTAFIVIVLMMAIPTMAQGYELFSMPSYPEWSLSSASIYSGHSVKPFFFMSGSECYISFQSDAYRQSKKHNNEGSHGSGEILKIAAINKDVGIDYQWIGSVAPIGGRGIRMEALQRIGSSRGSVWVEGTIVRNKPDSGGYHPRWGITFPLPLTGRNNEFFSDSSFLRGFVFPKCSIATTDFDEFTIARNLSTVPDVFKNKILSLMYEWASWLTPTFEAYGIMETAHAELFDKYEMCRIRGKCNDFVSAWAAAHQAQSAIITDSERP